MKKITIFAFSHIIHQHSNNFIENEEDSSSLMFEKYDSEKSSKNIIIYYFLKRNMFLYNNFFAICCFFLKKKPYYILPCQIHLFFLFYSIIFYFSIIAFIYGIERESSISWLCFFIGSIGCIFLFAVLTSFISKYYSDVCNLIEISNPTKKNKNLIYRENNNGGEIAEQSHYLEILMIFMMAFLAIFFILAAYQIIFNITFVSETLIGVLVCFFFDYCVIRVILILTLFFLFVFGESGAKEKLKTILKNDLQFKAKYQKFLIFLSEKMKKSQENNDFDESNIDFRSSDRIILKQENEEMNKSKYKENNFTFSHNEKNDKEEELKQNPNFKTRKESNIFDMSMSNAALLNGTSFPISNGLINDHMLDNNERGNMKTPSKSIIEIIETNKQSDFENNKTKEIEKIKNLFLKKGLNEIYEESKNSKENYCFGEETVIEENFLPLQQTNEIEKLIFLKGHFIKDSNKTNAKYSTLKINSHTEQADTMEGEETSSKKQNLKVDNTKFNDFLNFMDKFFKNGKIDEMKISSNEEVNFYDFKFIPNHFDAAKISSIDQNNIPRQEKDENLFKIKNQMFGTNDDNYLSYVMNKVKPSWYEEVFKNISNPNIAKSLKEVLIAKIKEINKLGENFLIGSECNEEMKINPLIMENDMEAIIIPQGDYYSNKKMKEKFLKDSEKNSKQTKIKKPSSLKKKTKKNEWLTEYIKFSEETLQNYDGSKNIFDENSPKNSNLAKTNHKKHEFNEYKFSPNALFLANFDRKYEMKNKNKTNKKRQNAINEKMKSIEKIKENNIENESENIGDLTPTNTKKEVNSPFVKINCFIENSSHKLLEKNPNKIHKKKYKASENSSALLENKKQGEDFSKTQQFNNFFDDSKKINDPRHHRFKPKEDFSKKNNLFIQTKETPSKNQQNIDYSDLDSVSKLRLEEAKKKALLGFI